MNSGRLGMNVLIIFLFEQIEAIVFCHGRPDPGTHAYDAVQNLLRSCEARGRGIRS